MEIIAAGKFKATCLGLLDQVERRRVPVLITKKGKPIAKLVPLDLPEGEDPLDAFRFPGLEIIADIETPLYTDEELEAFDEASAAQLR